MKRLMGLFAGILVVGAVGCGSSDSAAGTGATVMPIEQVPGEVAAIYCKIAKDCYGDFYSIIYAGVDCSSKLTSQISEKDLPNWKSSIEKGSLKYHGENARACLDAIAAQGCVMTRSRSPQVCATAIEGTIAAGGDCSFDSECVYGNYCKPGAACPGKCSPWESAGGACTVSDHCASGMTCAGGICLVPAGEGADCDSGKAECEAGLYCKGAKAGVPGKCAKLDDVFSVAEGQTCDLTTFSMCKIPDTCAVDSIVDKKLVTTCHAPSASGTACQYGFPDACPDDEYCVVDLTKSLAGTCSKLPKAEETCNTQKDSALCAPGLVCSELKCQALQKNGGACKDGTVCYSETCTNSVCSPGAPCK